MCFNIFLLTYEKCPKLALWYRLNHTPALKKQTAICLCFNELNKVHS